MDQSCEFCDGTGIETVLVETREGCGGWFSTDGKVFTEDMRPCHKCESEN